MVTVPAGSSGASRPRPGERGGVLRTDPWSGGAARAGGLRAQTGGGVSISTGLGRASLLAAPTVRVAAPSAPAPRWEARFRAVVVAADLVVLLVGLWVGVAVLGGGSSEALPPLTAAALVAALLGYRAWDPQVFGQGAEEYRRVGAAVLAAGVVLGLGALAVGAQESRPWVFGVLPATGAGLLVSRHALRTVLHLERRTGRCMLPVLAAGSVEEVSDLVQRTRRERHNGWEVTAACLPAGPSTPMSVDGVPVVGDLGAVPAILRHGVHRVVAVVPDPVWTRQRLRQLAWDLEGTSAELVVAPALMEVTGPRLHLSPVYGLTLLRVSKPTFSGARWAVKAALDRIVALVLLIGVLPVMAAIAVAVKLHDGGPVLFRQHRVGRAGREFPMLKFRSMAVDAERTRSALEPVNEGAGPLFKLRADPRITAVGAVLRRFSLDELPQLLNVVAGDMSLVGPRPPLPEEVRTYAFDARRRLLVKPGLTGLWQVSGRSDLTWEETVRLDLRYVENWSLAMDAVIIWKTLGAVIRGNGAY